MSGHVPVPAFVIGFIEAWVVVVVELCLAWNVERFDVGEDVQRLGVCLRVGDDPLDLVGITARLHASEDTAEPLYCHVYHSP